MMRIRHGALGTSLLVITVAATLLAGPQAIAAEAGSPAPDPTAAPDATGAEVVSVERIDDRTRDLTIASPAVGDAKVRLLLPADFEARSDERFPVLYLLHGGGGGYLDWTKNTDVESHTAAADIIVAMPDSLTANLGVWLEGGGPNGDGGLPNWERFHVDELPMLLAQDWRAAESRAVGGNSLGGYAAVMYASRRPDLYQAVGSYSGALGLALLVGAIDEVVEGDLDEDPVDVTLDEAEAVVDEAIDDVVDTVADVVEDPPADAESAEIKEIQELAKALAEGAGWTDIEAADLLPALGGASYVAYGNGEPGPLDPDGAGPDLLESWISGGNDDFFEELVLSDIPAEVNAYGPGTHAWAYWDRELQASLPQLVDAIGGSVAEADYN